MNHHPYHLLKQWLSDKDNASWVLGMVFRVSGSAYRKAGSLMLFSDRGEQLGLLSGGCLESDLQRQAMKALLSGKPVQVEYNSQDEDEVTYQLGIGCGGIVNVMLHPLTAQNDYLGLMALYHALHAGQRVRYLVSLPGKDPEGLVVPEGVTPPWPLPEDHKARVIEQQASSWLLSAHRPPPRLAVFGGGVDARPLVSLASALGWQVTLVDPRPSHGRARHFPGAIRVLSARPAEVADADWFSQMDAAVVMHHQVQLDAEALAVLAPNPPVYCALLGPHHRREQIIEEAGLEDFPRLAGPAGLALGAELPEGIALSILAECQAVLAGAPGHSISGILK